MKRITHLCTTDPAGAVYDVAEAMNRHTNTRSRVVCTKRIPEYDFDRHMSLGDYLNQEDGRDRFESHLMECDVLVVHKPHELNWLGGIRNTGGELRVQWDFCRPTSYRYEDLARGKRVIFYHHGEPLLRHDPEAVIKSQGYRDGDPVYVCSPDLLELLPMATYLPGCILNRDGAFSPVGPKHFPRRRELFRIGQSPTASWEKNTDALLEGARMAGMEHQVEVCPQTTRANVLRWKAGQHIFFDQLECGIVARNGLEAMAMGIPTLARITPEVHDHFVETFGEELPIFNVMDAEGISVVLEKLTIDRDLYLAMSEQSARFMRNRWDEAMVADIWLDRAIGEEF
jgi:hypothetical protein